MSTHKPNLRGLLSDTSRVIKSHFLHFLALAALFIFPSVVFSIIYTFLLLQTSTPPTLHQSLHIISSSEPQHGIPPTENPPVLVLIIGMLPGLFFSLCATASITYSTLQGFYKKPVELIASLKAVLTSFLPLLATNLVLGLIFILIGFAFGVLAFLAYDALTSMGFLMDYDGSYFLVFVILMTALFVLAVVYLQVKWFLSAVVVVVESSWGFQALRRSSHLVKGMRGIVLSVILLFGIPSGLVAFWYQSVLMATSLDHISWTFVVLTIVYAVIVTTLSLYIMAATAVLYTYCKAWQGGVVLEVDEELGMGYNRLPGDEDKASYAVNVV